MNCRIPKIVKLSNIYCQTVFHKEAARTQDLLKNFELKKYLWTRGLEDLGAGINVTSICGTRLMHCIEQDVQIMCISTLADIEIVCKNLICDRNSVIQK